MSRIKFTRKHRNSDEKRIRAENGKSCHVIELKLKRRWKLSTISLISINLMKSNGNPLHLFLPGESHGQRSLVGYRPWGHQELAMTKWLTFTFSNQKICRTLEGVVLYQVIMKLIWNFRIAKNIKKKKKKKVRLARLSKQHSMTYL